MDTNHIQMEWGWGPSEETGCIVDSDLQTFSSSLYPGTSLPALSGLQRSTRASLVRLRRVTSRCHPDVPGIGTPAQPKAGFFSPLPYHNQGLGCYSPGRINCTGWCRPGGNEGSILEVSPHGGPAHPMV